MDNQYEGVVTRFLHPSERLILSDEKEMPLVIEAKAFTSVSELQSFLSIHSVALHEDLAKYGAILLRGFNIQTELDFENTILSIDGMKGISEAFMSEEGRVPVGDLKYVLHTNAVYKTGGTVYLGGFHGENYYSPDVPAYISFCCFKPSRVGGETGLINTSKIYDELPPALKSKLENKSFFVSKWLVSEIAERYQISEEKIEEIAKHFDLPILGQGKMKFMLMYKPSVYKHPKTQKKALQINFFELASLNGVLRKQFMQDYQGKTWFWHRFFWKSPEWVLKPLERLYIMFASFFYSPKNALIILKNKWAVRRANKHLKGHDNTKVGSCFTSKEIENLGSLMRRYYCSSLWKKGDILIVDNRQVIHAGMPGEGPRLIRAMICNPLEMKYGAQERGIVGCEERKGEGIGQQMNLL